MSEATAGAPANRLPPAPASVAGPDGTPQTGLFCGSVADARFAALSAPYAPSFFERRLIEKRWQYVLVTTPEMMLCLAIIDSGYLASGFCGVFDRGSRRLLTDAHPVLPPISAHIKDPPGDGMSARLLGPGVRASIQRAGAEILIRATWAHTDLDLKLDVGRAPPPITAIAPVGLPGRFDFTQKHVLVPAEGEVRVANVRFPVLGGFAGLDYTHGYLARETSWRWAFGQGRARDRLVAFNFSEGFLQGEGENVAWIDGEPQPAGKVSFTFDGNAPSSLWRIRSEDGQTDLVFHPEGHRAQTIDLKVVSSRYLQPFGTFNGRVLGVAVDGLPGVTEDHVARW